jgi:hypothetical protein
MRTRISRPRGVLRRVSVQGRRGSPCLTTLCTDLAKHAHDSPPRIRIHRQEVDDVSPILPVLVALAHQAGGDRVTVGLVADQDAPEVVASLRGREFLSRAWRLTSCILSRAILRRSNLLVEFFVEFFDLLMRLRLDARDVIPWAFEMGDDLIELHV